MKIDFGVMVEVSHKGLALGRKRMVLWDEELEALKMQSLSEDLDELAHDLITEVERSELYETLRESKEESTDGR